MNSSNVQKGLVINKFVLRAQITGGSEQEAAWVLYKKVRLGLRRQLGILSHLQCNSLSSASFWRG